MNGRTVTQWGPNQPVFTAIKDSNNNMQVCVVSGTTAGSAPTWETNYGAITIDNTAQWVNVGPYMSWAANTIWYLPVVGFAAPSASQPYGGAVIKDSNGNVQYVIKSGKSAGSAPSWSTTIGGQTAESGGVPTWIMTGAASTNALVWTKGHVWAYSFKARTATDFYVTNTPPGLSAPLGPYKGSGTGAITTASPVNVVTGGTRAQ